jgi:RNA polymerase sigma factor (sigma-70 family)
MDLSKENGAPRGDFPRTHHSVIAAATSDDPEVRNRAFGTLVEAYWKPVYKYVRIKWQASNEEAQDLTQEFFARALEKRFFDSYDPGKARFRTYLRVCLDGLVANERKAARRVKRGGKASFVAMDFEGAEGELRSREIADDSDMDEYFHTEWIRSLFGRAVERLLQRCEASGKALQFELFRRYDLEGPEAPGKTTYELLGREFGLATTQVTNYLASARRQFRDLVLDELREITGSEDEFRQEARELFGVDP